MLTAAERKAVVAAMLPNDGDAITLAQTMSSLAAVEAIVAAKQDRAVAEALAPVRALAEEWERQAEDPDDPAYKIGLFSAAAEVRAALPAEPTTDGAP